MGTNAYIKSETDSSTRILTGLDLLLPPDTNHTWINTQSLISVNKSLVWTVTFQLTLFEIAVV